MSPAVGSGAGAENKQFHSATRRATESNVDWLARNLGGLKGSLVMLVGGRCALDGRLPAAQAWIPDDLTPSHWSHVMLVHKLAKKLRNTRISEISLTPVGGFEHPPSKNGVQTGRLHHYEDAAKYPNIAVICVPVSETKVATVLKSFQRQRSMVDAVELLLVWLGFAWGVGSSGNPLRDDLGMASAVMVEAVMSAAGFDLTPGVQSRSSCPDAVWQAAKWWHQYYLDTTGGTLSGIWHIGDRIE